MPRGDGTGPQGQGPRTGRGAGFCAGTDQPGYVSSPGGGRRFRQWGGGRGWANQPPAGENFIGRLESRLNQVLELLEKKRDKGDK